MKKRWIGVYIVLIFSGFVLFGCGPKYREIPVLKVREIKNEKETVIYENGWKARKVYDKFYEKLVWEIYDPNIRKWYSSQIEEKDNTFILTTHSEIKRYHDYEFDYFGKKGEQ